MVIIRCVVIVFCLLLSSCAKRQSPQRKNTINPIAITDEKKNLDTIIQQEAMLVDVPIPLYDQRILTLNNGFTQSETLVFGYQSPLSCAQAQDFFMSQMERYGWQHLITFESIDLLLQFSSPHRYCTVIIKKDDRDESSSCIFIYIKKVKIQSFIDEA